MLASAPSRWSRIHGPRFGSALKDPVSAHRLLPRYVRSLKDESLVRNSPSTGPLTTQWRVSMAHTRLKNHRTFLSETAQTILTPPIVFVGLLVTLWTYKCIMMVLFQDKIIYMPNMPPFSRSEKIMDYSNACKPVEWEERHIRSFDGTKIALCVGCIPEGGNGTNIGGDASDKRTKEVVICYFQGNGSSLPPRLPVLSNVLKIIQNHNLSSDTHTRYTLIGLSYRGYWTSSGRASQSGIELDAHALLHYIAVTYTSPHTIVEMVLWGQSVGSGVATTAAAKYVAHKNIGEPLITGLVLETPFSGIKSMLVAMYPQKWLPYRYLWPFLWNHWDSESALRQLSSFGQTPKILLLPATRDEVVPAEEADKLERACCNLGFEYERKNVVGALHHEATIRRDGQQYVARFVADITNR